MYRIYLLTSVLLLATLAKPGVSEEIFNIATDEWRPYHSEDLKHYGVISHIITEAFALEGVTVRWHWLPWKRVMVEAERGNMDGASLSLKTDEREKVFYYSDPLLIGKRFFFHRKDFPFKWDALEDLKGLRIAAIRGYHYGERFENAEKSGLIQVYRVTYIKQALKMLHKGRVDIYPIINDVGLDLIQIYFKPDQTEDFAYHPKVVHETAYFLIMSKQVERNVKMLKLFNRGLARLKGSGKYDQYMADALRGGYKK